MARRGKLLRFWAKFFMLLAAIFAALGAIIGLWTTSEIAYYKGPGDLLEKDIERRMQTKLPHVEIAIPAIFINVTEMKQDFLVEGGFMESGFTGEALVENYPLGEYLLSETERPQAMISAVKESVEQYLNLHPGSKASLVAVTGCADGATVLPGALYKGDLGTFRDFLFYSEDHGRFERMTLLAGETRLDNTAIAFLRAYNALQGVSALACLRDAEEQVRVETSPLRGGTYRRVFIRVMVRDALKYEYQRLSLPTKLRLELSKKTEVPGLHLPN